MLDDKSPDLDLAGPEVVAAPAERFRLVYSVRDLQAIRCWRRSWGDLDIWGE